MAEYNSLKNIGGKNNSKIDNQDSVATVLAIEQINNRDIFNFGCQIADFCIKCEGDDDIEIFNQDEHIYIQVKSAEISKKDFLSILDNFMEIEKSEKEVKKYYVLLIFDTLVVDNKKIAERLDDYVQVLMNEYETVEKKQRVKDELIGAFGLEKYRTIIDRLRIVNRPLLRSLNDTEAVFARSMRLYYLIRDAGDCIASELYKNLCEVFAEARRQRSFVKRSELESMLNKSFCRNTYFSLLSIMEGYKKIENGYVKDENFSRKRNELLQGFSIARKKLYKGWRKHHCKEVLKSIFVGAKNCPRCGHPMMANFYGLNGIACPDCGFSPYVTMITFCECGEFEVIKRQPDFSAENQIRYIQDYVSNRKDDVCHNCGKKIFDEYFEQRIFYAPIPYPYDDVLSDEEMYKDSPY